MSMQVDVTLGQLLARLPDELLIKIFHLLSLEGHRAMRFFCRRYSRLAVYRPVNLLRMLSINSVEVARTPNWSIWSQPILWGIDQFLISDPLVFSRFRNIGCKIAFSDLPENVDFFLQNNNNNNPALQIFLSAIRTVEIRRCEDKMIKLVNNVGRVEDLSILSGLENVPVIKKPEKIRTLYVVQSGPHRDIATKPGGDFFDQSFPSLEILSMGKVAIINMDAFFKFAYSVVKLYLHECFGAESDFNGQVFCLFTNLEELHLTCKTATPRSIIPVLSGFLPKIKGLNVDFSLSQIEAYRMIPVAEIARMHTLKSLRFSSGSYQLSRSFMGNLLGLELLIVYMDFFNTDDNIDFILPLADTLRELVIEFDNVEEGSVIDAKIFDGFSKLQNLQLLVDQHSVECIEIKNPMALTVPSGLVARQLVNVCVDIDFKIDNTQDLRFKVTNSDPFHPTKKKKIDILGIDGIEEEEEDQDQDQETQGHSKRLRECNMH